MIKYHLWSVIGIQIHKASIFMVIFLLLLQGLIFVKKNSFGFNSTRFD